VRIELTLECVPGFKSRCLYVGAMMSFLWDSDEALDLPLSPPDTMSWDGPFSYRHRQSDAGDKRLCLIMRILSAGAGRVDCQCVRSPTQVQNAVDPYLIAANSFGGEGELGNATFFPFLFEVHRCAFKTLLVLLS
jgi:hypothetical protein